MPMHEQGMLPGQDALDAPDCVQAPEAGRQDHALMHTRQSKHREQEANLSIANGEDNGKRQVDPSLEEGDDLSAGAGGGNDEHILNKNTAHLRFLHIL